ncbi:transcription-repair coupling factor [Thalassotalea ponticola]|uniref:transcription-repair coupling factor n=1 Tax=Thalassotalea ponticola TaxID=1523392 RepID=UPI0025B34AAC|nr:transcription-repair coupling factor [Thalassotalea ponticola]MDN3652616.1 transcription-repair coupling factor [Thalassotalea ponticola]
MTTAADIFTPPVNATKATTRIHNDKKQWLDLAGSSDTIAIYHGALAHKGLTLLVTQDTACALRLEHELGSISQADLDICLFPDWETLPYDSFSPHQDIISQRLLTLYKLSRMTQGIVIVPAHTLTHRIAPKQYIDANTLIIKTGDNKDINKLRLDLEQSGYRAVDQVMEHGEFSARGAIVDLYPMGSNVPFRLDFFDDEIESIRTFDVDSQRSADTVKAIELLPAHEFPTDQEAINLFRQNYREQLKVSNDKDSIYYQVSKGIIPAGIEYYLPLFFEHTETLFDYLPSHTLLINYGDTELHLDQFIHDLNFRYEDRRYDPLRPLLAPSALFLSKEQLFAQFKDYQRIDVAKNASSSAGKQHFATQALPKIAVNHQLKQPLAALIEFINQCREQSLPILFVAESQGRRETLSELLQREQIKATEVASLDQFLTTECDIAISVNALAHGFIYRGKQPFALITEDDLFADRVKQRRRSSKSEQTNSEALFKNLTELSIGQPVVHIEHGIGRYQGLQTFENQGVVTEFLTLSYANDAKLYVPVASLHMISRYSGGESETTPLHKLGTDAWQKAKKKAAEKVQDVAAELLDIYAKRESSRGYQFKRDKKDYQAFADSFGFEETDDQQQAITQVIADMLDHKPMDRLVCGDVGFGKTEVAMRAAFIAANDSKQVVVLVPTTLLAQQHYENFKDRFANWPINIEVLSRFKTAKQQKLVIDDVASGKIDILIGTHKLLSDDIKFHDLGLLIVDEEHRFGVKQKEKIKRLRANVDILTLTATPIPRTLNMAMGGMRDLSIIATPPAKRLAVKTFVRQRDDNLIRESVLREVLRGGQVYFLHNNVKTIEKTAQDLQQLLPEAKITVAHGQMRERELEQIMSDFYHQRFNVLVCTTIIETGIDIPTANTIIMDRADHLGLAQLHQLRGRVGRSHHQAYAYLLTPHPKRMTKDAIKRLDAIAQLEDLGAGFALATHDLEIRGAGELLGEDQSGQMASIGFSLYMDMLDQAVDALKQGKQPALDDLTAQQTDVDLKLAAILPEDYIGDVNMRLSLYKRIASAKDNDELDDIQVELIDRFGLLPDAAKNLFHSAKLKLKAQQLGIKRVDANANSGSIEFADDTKVEPMHIINLIQSQPAVYKMDGANKLTFRLPSLEDGKQRISALQQLLTQLGEAA